MEWIIIYEVVLLCVFLSLSFFCSISEAVLMSLGVDRVEQLIETKQKSAKTLRFVMEKSNEILTTILIINTFANIVAGSVVTTLTMHLFNSEKYVAYMLGATTVIILFFGEIVPKTIGRAHSEKLAVFVFTILRFCYYLFYPLVETIMLFAKILLGDRVNLRGKLVTTEELEYMVSKAQEDKSIDSKQINFLNSILEFPMIKVKDIMIPRSKVKYLTTDSEYDDVIKSIKNDAHSRYPVCKDGLDETVGFLHVKDLAFITESDRVKFNITKHLKTPFFVYEHMKIQAVFDHMNRKKVHLALVKNEMGMVVGVVTLEDIIEEIFGEIHDEHDLDEAAKNERDLGTSLTEGLLIDSSVSVRELVTDYKVYLEQDDSYSTLSGFILYLLGNQFPKQGQIVVWEGYSFELVKVENASIKKVVIRISDMEKVAQLEEKFKSA